MFDKKSPVEEDKKTIDVFRPAKGSAKVVIGNGVKIKGEITDADEVQIDGTANVTMKTDNLIVGATGNAKGSIDTHNADIWGNMDGDVKISGTLTIQEAGTVSGTVEYQNLQIKLGGQINGDVKVTQKVKNIKDKVNKENDQNSSSLQSSLTDNK